MASALRGGTPRPDVAIARAAGATWPQDGPRFVVSAPKGLALVTLGRFSMMCRVRAVPVRLEAEPNGVSVPALAEASYRLTLYPGRLVHRPLRSQCRCRPTSSSSASRSQCRAL